MNIRQRLSALEARRGSKRPPLLNAEDRVIVRSYWRANRPSMDEEEAAITGNPIRIGRNRTINDIVQDRKAAKKDLIAHHQWAQSDIRNAPLDRINQDLKRKGCTLTIQEACSLSFDDIMEILKQHKRL
ncbi:MAG: hypothetical protein WC856_10065 [Methylococcaceae bacterium]|jgi:hypothetical protein